MVTVLDHPLIQDKLTQVRDRQTRSDHFRKLVDEIAVLMAYDMTRDLQVKQVPVETPVGTAMGIRIAHEEFAIATVLRAGLGMVNGFLEVIPQAQVVHVGLYRDHDTLEPVQYYRNMPASLPRRHIIIVDPMLATGGSLVATTEILVAEGPRSIKVACLVAAPEGVAAFEERFPDIPLFVAAIDEGLNQRGYIVPGLGDAGDRLFNT